MNSDRLRQLQDALRGLEALIAAAVERAKAAGQNPTEALRGLVVTEGEIDTLLTREPLAALWPGMATPSLPDTHQSPLEQLARTFALDNLDRAVLLLTLAAELDRRYERLFAFLQDDVSQRRPTVNLAMNLLGGTVEERFAVWSRLATPDAPLRLHHLVECLPDPHQREPVFLAYQLKLDGRIVAHLLGSDRTDARLDGAVTVEKAGSTLTPSADAPLVYLQRAGGGRLERIDLLGEDDSLPLTRADVEALKALPVGFELAWRLALREAQLGGTALLLENWERALDDNARPPQDLWDALLGYEYPVYLCGRTAWEPGDLNRSRRLLRLKLGALAFDEQVRAWDMALGANGIRVTRGQAAELASKFRFTAGQIARAAQSALDYAATRGEAVTPSDLYAGAQAQSSLKLGKLAGRIYPRYGWDDLILPADRKEQLREMVDRSRYSHVVRDDWGFGRKVAPNGGVSALFAGESGTGKTMAAEVIASELGLVLYRIDLSSVVSKYIGETEKNLSAIFEEANSSNAVLFFDEADALFGKRSEVKDAHDRYANIEIAYLLQQIEGYDGIAIMATNLRQNLDEAFTRRLDFLIDFPFPDVEYRRLIWAAHLPAEAPLAADVNLDDLATRYRLAGGNISNAALAAAYLAAADGGTITMTHLRQAVRREHQKMGRLLE